MRAQISGKDRVLITGLGPVGLGTALLAQKLGAKVLGLESQPARVEFARKLGIESLECVKGNAAGKEGEADIKAVVAWSGGEGVDVAIDCSGAANARLTCIRGARVWGRVVFVGEEGQLEIDVSEDIIHKNLTILGSWVCSTAQMEELVDLLVRWNLHPEVRADIGGPLNNVADQFYINADYDNKYLLDRRSRSSIQTFRCGQDWEVCNRFRRREADSSRLMRMSTESLSGD